MRKQQEKENQKRISSSQAEKQTPEKGSLGYENWLLQDFLTKTFTKLLIEDDEDELTSVAATADAKSESGTKDGNEIPSSSKTGASDAQQTVADRAKVDQSGLRTASSESQDLDDDADLDADEEDEDVEISQEELESAFAKIFLSLLNEVEKGLQQEQTSRAALSNTVPQGVSEKFDTPESDGATLGDGDGSVHSSAADEMSERLSKLRGEKVTVAKVQLKSPFGENKKTEAKSVQKVNLVDQGLRAESSNLKETVGKSSSGYHERQTVERRYKSDPSEEPDDEIETGHSAGEEGYAVDEQEWDEEMLRELEQEVQEALRQELGEAGLQDQGE